MFKDAILDRIYSDQRTFCIPIVVLSSLIDVVEDAIMEEQEDGQYAAVSELFD